MDSCFSQDQYPGFPKVSSPVTVVSDNNYYPSAKDALEPTVPPILPIFPTNEARTLILCFDGTGDQFDADNSNIVNFFTMLRKDRPEQQMVYYQAGIGTYTIPQIAKPLTAKFHKLMDAMVGVHLDAHVMGGYEFLMQNCRYFLRFFKRALSHYVLFIFITGFSRGAYTARALAGMLHKVGLLPRDNHQQVPFAYKMYSREDKTGWEQSAAFKKAFSIDVDIELIGVWDTVGSVGLVPKRLPFTTFNTHVRHFRQALALDEHRVRFKPTFFNRPTPEEIELGLKWGEEHNSKKKSKRRQTRRELERQYPRGQHITTVEEVWFAGCHCDVGGGAVKNEIRNNLSRIPLRWMIRECFKLKTGIIFHRDSFKMVGLDPTTLWPDVRDRPQPVTTFSRNRPKDKRDLRILTDNGAFAEIDDFVNEEEEDLADALSKKYDQLKISRSWWILEFIPQKIRFQKDDDDKWVQKFSINRGRGRVIPKQRTDGMKIHRTVQLRMQMKVEENGKHYKPNAHLIDNVKIEWVK
ncbi:hypothetical protein GALMADRAFT_102896 [Galerina marginata CBS 339.88]|uniref:T6SS Phospholipase effector Tle1-like catalytic domain-containing protein n=1 Tax=Galerina marginata (strain CBS 339.88) TaxID=685588 RepID=A0A067SIV0_GALM3|nr:hypothetical protein GALMADRAFT_102896 [Galerina marginata CBS 339.88]